MYSSVYMALFKQNIAAKAYKSYRPLLPAIHLTAVELFRLEDIELNPGHRHRLKIDIMAQALHHVYYKNSLWYLVEK